MALIIALCIAITLGSLLLFLEEPIISVYTNIPSIKALIFRIDHILALVVFCNCISGSMVGQIRGLGVFKQALLG